MQGSWIKRGKQASVVFVHGVLSDGQTCWRHTNGTYWPELLAAETGLQSVGIYVFTYKTGFFSGTYRLGDVVDSLKEHMDLDDVLGAQNLIFVCHSMGGIVARKYVVARATELVERGIKPSFFMLASPSLGSEYANWLAPLARVFSHTQADALRFAQTNAWLMDLDVEFQNLKASGRMNIRGKELVEDNFIVLKRLWRRQVVAPFSGAKYFGEPYKVPNSDHISIAKVASEGDIQHRQLVRFIDEILADAYAARSSASASGGKSDGPQLASKAHIESIGGKATGVDVDTFKRGAISHEATITVVEPGANYTGIKIDKMG